jgi:hypothetical protein
VNESIHLADISGDLSAESTNGSIILDRIDSANVDLYTVNGNISYDGAIKDKGLYRLTTHNGLIAMPIADKANAALTVRTYNGGFRSTFPIGDPEKRNKRFTVTLGNGSAHVELESFGGTISLRRPSDPRPETERKRRSEKDKEKDKGNQGAVRHHVLDDLAVEAEVARAMAEAQPEIERALAEAQPEIERALAEAQPEIDAAVAEAMAELGHLLPHLSAHAVPTAPPPRPRGSRGREQFRDRFAPLIRIPQLRSEPGGERSRRTPLAEARRRQQPAPALPPPCPPPESDSRSSVRGAFCTGRSRPALLSIASHALEEGARRQRRLATAAAFEKHRLRPDTPTGTVS